MMTNYLFTLFLFTFLLWNCQGESATETGSAIAELEAAYDANPNGDNLDALLQVYAQDSTGAYAEKAAYLKLSNNRTQEGIKDLKQLLRTDHKGAYAVSLANAYKEQQQDAVAFTAYQAYLNAFPNHEQAATISRMIPQDMLEINVRMNTLFEEAKVDSIRRVRPTVVNDFINSAEAIALIQPTADSVATHLQRAASFAQFYQRDVQQALSFYQLLIDDHANTKEREFALFSSAFIYDDELGDLEKAQQYYERFLQEYPSSDFADDATVLLENLGKDDEEILEGLLKKQEG